VLIAVVLLGLAWYLERGGTLGGGSVEPADRGIFSGFFPTDSEDTGGGGTPFGGAGGDGGDGRGSIRLGGGEGEARELPALRKIAEGPVVGATVFLRDGEPLARYADRRTGHIYEVDLSTDNTKRLTGTTIPAGQEMYWNKDGSQVIFLYIDDDSGRIVTFAGTVHEDTNEFNGSFITGVPLALASSQDSDRIFAIFNVDNSAVGIATDYDGNRRVEIFSLPFREWRALWPNTGTIALTTKPSKNVDGHMYFVNTQTGGFRNILNGILGLTALTSPDADTVLYSKSTPRGFETYFFDDGESERLAISTFPPDKCVWAADSVAVYCGVPTAVPRGDYPDDWYQGQVSLSDDIWIIDRESGFTDRIASPNVLGEDIDIIDPKIDEESTHIIFMNKKDRSLWTLRL